MPDLQNPAIRMESYQQEQSARAAQNYRLWELGVLALSTNEIQQGQLARQQAMASSILSQTLEMIAQPLSNAPQRELSAVY